MGLKEHRNYLLKISLYYSLSSTPRVFILDDMIFADLCFYFLFDPVIIMDCYALLSQYIYTITLDSISEINKYRFFDYHHFSIFSIIWQNVGSIRI